jgi:hypothetical protein
MSKTRCTIHCNTHLQCIPWYWYHFCVLRWPSAGVQVSSQSIWYYLFICTLRQSPKCREFGEWWVVTGERWHGQVEFEVSRMNILIPWHLIIILCASVTDEVWLFKLVVSHKLFKAGLITRTSEVIEARDCPLISLSTYQQPSTNEAHFGSHRSALGNEQEWTISHWFFIKLDIISHHSTITKLISIRLTRTSEVTEVCGGNERFPAWFFINLDIDIVSNHSTYH